MLIALKQLITLVVEKNNNLNEQNFEIYWKTRSEDRGSRMEDRGTRIGDRGLRIGKKKIENKVNK